MDRILWLIAGLYLGWLVGTFPQAELSFKNSTEKDIVIETPQGPKTIGPWETVTVRSK